MSRLRLDQELVRRELFPSRSAARNAIRAGFVRIDGAATAKPALHVTPDTDIEVATAAGHYVGRGAYKLAAALESFPVRVEGRSAIDVGSSTGGFVEVLLQEGVESVVALDVGRDQLHPRLRADPRVVVSESTNVRDVDVALLDGPFGVVTADLSFISLVAVARDLERLGDASADWIVLVKPQFEVGRDGLSKDGIVRSADMRNQAIADVVAAFASLGLISVGIMASPITGGSGNREALLWLRRDGRQNLSDDAFKVLGDE